MPVGSTPRRQLAFLAALMRANGQQTLYLEAVQPAWLTPAGYDRTPTRLAVLVAGLGFGLAVGLGAWQNYGLVVGLVVGPVVGLGFGLVLADKMRDPPVVADRAWSWRAVVTRQNLVNGLGFGLIAGLGAGLGTWLGFRLVAGLASAPRAGLLAGLVSGLGLGLLAVVAGAWRTVPAVKGRSARPTHALLRSAGNGAAVLLFIALAAILIGGLGFGLISGPTGGSVSLVGGLAAALALGLFFGLDVGLSALLAHTTTRITAAAHGLLPIRLVTFLNNAAMQGIMYPAGPGYRFRHRTLAEHLAHEDSNTAP